LVPNNKLGNSKWAELDTGRNSVSP